MRPGDLDVRFVPVVLAALLVSDAARAAEPKPEAVDALVSDALKAFHVPGAAVVAPAPDGNRSACPPSRRESSSSARAPAGWP